MKIIDEKGRLFGKINIIDFLVLIFLFCLLPMFYFGYKLFNRPVNIAESPKVFIELEINSKFIKIKPEDLRLINIGDKEIDTNGIVAGEITWMGEANPYRYTFNIGGGNTLIKEDPFLKELPARLNLRLEVKDDKLYYQDKQILPNLPINFKTDKYALVVIVSGEQESMPRKIVQKDKIDLGIIFKDVSEDTLKLVSKGDRVLDQKGEIIAEILDIGKIENNTYEFDLTNGNFVLGEDSTRKQINVKLRLKTEINDNQLYFNGQRLINNSLIEFKTDKYLVKGRLSKIYEFPISQLKEKWVEVWVKFSGVIPELDKVIVKGDTEKEPAGGTVAVLKKIISNKYSEVLTLKDEKFIIVSHPFQKDIVARLNLLCTEKDGILYFKNYPVKMGNMITFTTDLYSINGIIVNLEMK